MTRSDLISQLSELYPQTEPSLMEDAVSLFFFEIGVALQRKDRVELRGFGSFCLRKRDKKIGRNPKTGEKVEVDEKWVPFFKAGKEMKQTINQKGFLSPHVKPQKKVL